MILFLESDKLKLEIAELEGKILLGRANDNTYVIDDPSVSRHHLEIYYRGNKGWTVRDLESSAGTFVNGTRVKEPVEINVGDILKIGALKFNVHFKGGEDSPQGNKVRTKVLQEESAKQSAEIALNKTREAKTSMIPIRPEETRITRKPPESSGIPWAMLLVAGALAAVAGFAAYKFMTAPTASELAPAHTQETSGQK